MISKDLFRKNEEQKKKILFSLLFGYFLFLFIVVLIRSVISGITYDEAYTYMNFGRENIFDLERLKRLFSVADCIANNHWMNSFLIRVCQLITGADYNEFVIRIPSLLFFVIYLVGVYYGYKKKQYSLIALLFLISNYYLLEYYGLARGYGMANTCLFFACLAYGKWKNSQYVEMKYLNWLMIYIGMAVFSNTIVLLLYPAFGLLCLLRIIQTKSFKQFIKKCGILFILFMIFSAVMIVYHMHISSEGKPLYTGGNQGFFECIVKGYAGMFALDNTLVLILSILCVVGLAAGLLLVNKEIIKCDFSLMLLIFIATNIIMQLLLHKGYIATRTLIPFYSFIVLAFHELFSKATERIRDGKGIRVKKAILFALGAALIISTISQTNLKSTRDYATSYRFRIWTVASQLTGQPFSTDFDEADAFYQRKCYLLKDIYLTELGK